MSRDPDNFVGRFYPVGRISEEPGGLDVERFELEDRSESLEIAIDPRAPRDAVEHIDVWAAGGDLDCEARFRSGALFGFLLPAEQRGRAGK